MTATTKAISLVLIGSGLSFGAWRLAQPPDDEKDKDRHSTTGGYHGGGHANWFWHTSSGFRSGGPSTGQAGGVSSRGGFGAHGTGAGA